MPSLLKPAYETSPELAELYAALSRWPDVEAPELVAVDAADRLLVDTVAAMLDPLAAVSPTGETVQHPRIVVFGETYGGVALGLASVSSRPDEDQSPVLVVTDSQVHRNAIWQNAVTTGHGRDVRFCELEELATEIGDDPVLAVAVAPRAHAVLEEWSDAAARMPGILGMLVGGKIKHMSMGMNDVLAGSFSDVQASRARQKARLLWASGPRDLPARDFRMSKAHDVGLREPLRIVAVPGAFGAERLDPGTRLLLPVLAQELAATTPPVMVDLGCGNGTISAFAKLIDPELEVTATDVSRAAVRSTQLTAEANGVEIRTLLDDALSTWPDASEDFIVLNPPFHVGNAVNEDIAYKLFEAAGRVLRPGGTLLAVWNSPLAYSRHLRRLVGQTKTVASNAKFQVTRTIR